MATVSVLDVNSLYSTTNLARVYPAWSKIVIAGHPQGGGMAPRLLESILTINRKCPVIHSITHIYCKLIFRAHFVQGVQAAPYTRNAWRWIGFSRHISSQFRQAKNVI